MRLYLSSYRLGTYPERIVELTRRPAPRVLVIMNAIDALPASKRLALQARLAEDFSSIGIETRELDLRGYFARPDSIVHELGDCDLVWASGGNAFTLLMAMTQSGFVSALKELLTEDRIVYGGHSAGAIVATPTLRGIDLVDSADPAVAAPVGYAPEIQWEGMALVSYSIAPHFRSNHSESAAMDAVVQYFIDTHMPYRALRDGEAIVVDGDVQTRLTL